MTFLPALLGVLLLSGQQPADARAEAERLARTGAHAEALKQFQTIVAANPDDVPARLWIARLHALMGHQERAIGVYRSILVAEPQNVEALIGAGTALTDIRRYSEAADMLTRAESLAPDQPAVLAAQGRLHHFAGRSTLALAYYERALVLDPANAQVRGVHAGLVAERAHRVEATYYGERFSDEGLSDTQAGVIEVNARVSDPVRLFATGQHQRKFSRRETRGGGGVEWSPRAHLRFRAGVLFGNSTRVLAESETSVLMQYQRDRLVWLAAVRYLDFDGSSTLILSPGVMLSPSDRVDVSIRYFHSNSDFEFGRSEGNDGIALETTGRVGRQFWVTAGYLHGFEGLPVITSDRVSQIDANTVTAGFRVDPAALTSLVASFSHQWREFDRRQATVFVTLIQRF
jgi:tetratricopeptide (TPR) repeat protein